MPPLRQTSFIAGELDPKLWGRTDLPLYGHGLRTARNFFINHQGAAISRPGFRYVGRGRRFFITGTERPRLLPFIYSDDQSYVLELGHQYVRFWSNGGYVVDPSGDFAIDYDNLIGGFLPGMVIIGNISGATATVVTDHNFGTRGFLVVNTVTGTFQAGEVLEVGIFPVAAAVTPLYAQPLEKATPWAYQDVFELQYAQSGDVMRLSHLSYTTQELSRVAHDNWTLANFTTRHAYQGFNSGAAGSKCYLKATRPDTTAITTEDIANGKTAREWTWAVTVIYRKEGMVAETKPFFITEKSNALPPAGVAAVPTKVAVYVDYPVTVLCPTTTVIGYSGEPLSVQVYRGRNDFFGWVGELKWGETEFTDVGQEPDYARAPPKGRNPFEVYDDAGTLVRTEEPAAVAYFQDRLCFGGTEERPERFFGSRQGDYINFDEHLVLLADDQVEFGLLSRKRETIRSLCPLNRLIINTNVAIWSLAGQVGNGLSPLDAPDLQVVEEVGASHVTPLIVDGAMLYARVKGHGVRAVVRANTDAGYDGINITLLAEHLFGAEVVDWCYAEDPFRLVWTLMSDGTLRSLTFNRTDQVWAWTHHDTNGTVLAICSVPEGTRDAVYILVDRGGTAPYVERMEVRDGFPGYDGTGGQCALDSSLRYIGAPGTDVATITGLSHLEGKDVMAVANVVKSTLVDAGLPTEHYEYKLYRQAYGPLTVTGGSITLPEVPPRGYHLQVIDVGLGFTCDLETLDVAQAAWRTRPKIVTHVGLEATEAIGVQVGQDFEHLVEASTLSVDEAFDGPSEANELILVATDGTWDTAARAVLRQEEPFPVTIVGLTRKVQGGDDGG